MAERFRSRTKPEERLAELQREINEDSDEDDESVNALRFYVSAFNIDEAFLRAFTMPKGRSQGSGAVFSIKYVDAALDAGAFAAEFFIEFGSTVWQHKLIKRLKALGAGSVSVATFARNDYNQSAAYALARVWSTATKPDHVSYVRGVCAPALLDRARAELYYNHRNEIREQGQSNGLHEFDVVKKRQRIDASSEPYASSPDALARFEDFERHTLPALLAVHADDLAHRAKEMEEFEDDVFSGNPLPVGGVYFARSAAIQALKIGATRRPEPGPRLRELSRCVPAPFELVAWLPAARPFKLERAVHAHFAESRIRASGACTEFFSVEDAVAAAYARTLAGTGRSEEVE